MTSARKMRGNAMGITSGVAASVVRSESGVPTAAMERFR